MFGLPFPIPDWAAKALAFALAALALLLIGRQWGASGVYEDWIAANAEGAAASVKIIQKQDVVTEKIVTEYRDRIIKVAGVNTTIEKEVTRYVEGKPGVMACMLDSVWLRLHDAAAGSLSTPTSGLDGAGTGEAKASP